MTLINKQTSLESSVIPTHRIHTFELIVSLFCALVSLGMVRLYALGRSGYEISYSDLNNVSGISLFILLLPVMINAIDVVLLGKNRTNFIGCSAIITLLAITFVIFCSYMVRFTGYWLLSTIAVLGHIFLVLAFLLFIRYSSVFQWLAVSLFSILMLLWLAGRVYSSYHSPLFFENLALGLGNMDTLFSASIMQMIKTYGIPSTGLNGTPYIPYHWGSNWLFAKFSIFLNTTAVTTYNLVYPALFLCLYFKTSLSLSYDIARQVAGKYSAPLAAGIKFWLFFLVIHVGFLPYSFLQNWAVWDSWIESESYLVSLIFLFVTASVILLVYNRAVKRKNLSAKLWLLLIPVLVPAIGLFKVSVLVLAVAALLYLFLKLKLYRNIIHLITIIITVYLSYHVVRLTAIDFIGEDDNFYPFHFVRTYMLTNWKGLFYYVHYFWALLYIILRLKQHNTFTFKSLFNVFKTNELLDVEILIVIAVAGLLPGSLLRIGGGSAYYFTDLQARVAIPLVLAFVLYNRQGSLHNSYSFNLSHYLKKYALIIPLILFLMLTNVLSKFEDAININMANRILHTNSYTGSKGYLENAPADIVAYISGKKSAIGSKLEDLKIVPNISLENNQRYIFYKHLASIDQLPVQEKAGKAIYLPQGNTWFWNDSFSNPLMVPFLIPALTGVRSVGSLPASFDFNYILAYGYQTYRASIENNDYKSLTKENICTYANEKNIPVSEFLYIEPLVNQISTFSCTSTTE
jgi:hypothetical protein